MQIELRNVKYAAFASEETSCFEAAVYIDGVKEGTVSNEGRGGCNSYWPRALEEKLDAYAKTLPGEVTKYLKDDGTPYVYQPDADSVISDAFERAMQGKKLAKYLKSKIVLVEGKQISTLNWDKRFTPAQYEDHVAKKYPGATVLNSMTFEQALDKWMEVLP